MKMLTQQWENESVGEGERKYGQMSWTDVDDVDDDWTVFDVDVENRNKTNDEQTWYKYTHDDREMYNICLYVQMTNLQFKKEGVQK